MAETIIQLDTDDVWRAVGRMDPVAAVAEDLVLRTVDRTEHERRAPGRLVPWPGSSSGHPDTHVALESATGAVRCVAPVSSLHLARSAALVALAARELLMPGGLTVGVVGTAVLRERVSGQARRGIVLRDAVVSVRSEILAVLTSWCGLVSAQRDVPGPDGLDIRRLAHHLAVHLPWLCGHPAAPDLADELAGLTDAIDEALRPGTGFRVRVGPCPHPGCPELVHAEAHREGAAPYEVGCAGGHVWTLERWLLLWGKQNGLAQGSSAGEGTP